MLMLFVNSMSMVIMVVILLMVLLVTHNLALIEVFMRNHSTLKLQVQLKGQKFDIPLTVLLLQRLMEYYMKDQLM